MRPRLLDLFCGAGGCAKGYHDAGFEVVGVDIKPQPLYPYEFHRMDALEFLRLNYEYDDWFHAVHASPPCQHYSACKVLNDKEHADLVDKTRDALIAIGRPWIIENVVGAPMRPSVMLCGAMFGLRTYRHRWFESNITIPTLIHPTHIWPQVKMGRTPKPGEFVQAVGHFSGVAEAREAMGIDWMGQKELAQAIPPAYTRYIGEYLMEAVRARKAA